MSKKTILIIEDSLYLAESLADMLVLKKYKPLIANNGLDGVDLALKKHPDLILLDIRLPDIDGYEVYRLIRQNKWGANARIVVLTASESIDNISKNINLSIDNILFKPNWSIQKLSERIADELIK